MRAYSGGIAEIQEKRRRPADHRLFRNNRKISGLTSGRAGCRGARAELFLERRNARLQDLVVLARQPGHFLDGLELLALDQVEVAQPLLGLSLEDRLDLAPDPLRH